MIYNSSVNSIDSSAIAAVSLKFHYKITNSSCHAKEGGANLINILLTLYIKSYFSRVTETFLIFPPRGGAILEILTRTY